MNTTEKFSISRFAALLRWTWSRERRFCLRAFAALVVAYLIAEMSFMTLRPSALPLVTVSRAAFDGSRLCVASLAVIAVSWCVLFVGFTMIMHDCSGRRHAATAIMLPATRLEKMLARLLAVTAGTLLMQCAALAVADVVRMAVQRAAIGYAQPSVLLAMSRLLWGFLTSGTDGFIATLSALTANGAAAGVRQATVAGLRVSVDVDHTSTNLIDTIGIWTSGLFSLSLAACCGTVFRRVPWLAAAVAVGAVSLAGSTSGLGDTAEAVVDAVLAVVLAALAWRGFCRIQINNNKLTNL